MRLVLPELRVGRGERTLYTTPPLTLEPGRRVVLLGANGSGKSTFLNCLAGLVADYDKAWCLDSEGRPFRGFPEATALVPQNPYTAFFAPTVEREIAFPLENQGLERSTMIRCVEEALEWAEITHLRLRPGPTLSGGEAQRVHLAVAWARRPSLLLLDEPLAFLDHMAALDFVGKLACWEGAALVVDHNPTPWQGWATEWWFLSPQGRLEVLDRPPHLPKSEWRPAGSPTPTPLLQVEDLWVRYGDGPWVLRGLTFSLQRGETVALLGPSGCGKSTVFRALTGQLKPQRGRLVWAGSPLPRGRALPLGSALLLPQNPEHFFWKPTVQAEAEQDGVEPSMLRRFGLDNLVDRSPFHLSAGEQRRLTLACSLGKDRDLLLLDEPGWGLDARAFTLMVEDLHHLQQNGKSLLIITHHRGLAELAHRRLDLTQEAHRVP